MTTPTVRCDGRERSYNYGVYPIGTPFNPVSGNYIFARLNAANQYEPVYIGETGDLSTRFDGHHKMPCIRGAGATHILVHQNDNYLSRLTEERDLVARWRPPCNG